MRAGGPEIMWFAYYTDWSGFAVFDNELEALRYAVEWHMKVTQIKPGIDIRDQIREN